MRPVLTAVAFGILLSIVGFDQAAASPIAVYSGSYSIVTNSPATEGIVSLRVRVEPLFADCSFPGQCIELVVANGVGDADSGTSFTLSLGAMLNAISDGTQLFAFSMNFGSSYSEVASGGGVGFFTSSLGDLYFGQPVDSATFTIDRLLFSPVDSQFGTGTQAVLEYTFALHGSDANPGLEAPILIFAAETDSTLLTVANPEPASWLMMAMAIGGAAAWKVRRR